MADKEEKKAAKKKQKKVKSTVKARKRSAKAATQRFVPIAEIRNDTVLLKKTVLAELLAALPQLAAPRSGRRVLVLPTSAR